MLSPEDLLTQNSCPGIKNVSLHLYKQFYVDTLLKRLFRYYFLDGDIIDVYFWELGLYHLLGIQHIDYHIKKESFLSDIDNGLELTSFHNDKPTKKRLINMSSRIELFACIYDTLKCARVFYVPTEIVKNTKDVKMDYILFRNLDNKGFNVGLKPINGVMTPITILVDRNSQRGKHVDFSKEKKVSKLEVFDITNTQLLEEIVYSDSFITKGC